MTTAAVAPRGRLAREPDRLVELQRDDPAWLELVAAAPGATFFHLPAWTRVVADTYGYRTTVLAECDEGGRVVAGIPVASVRRPAGRALVSLPFTDHCAPLARDEASLRRLAAGLAAWSSRERVPVEVRGPVPSVAGWRETVVGVEHVLPLEEGADALRSRLSEAHRRRLRQAERSGLRVRVGRRPEDMDAFYRLHLLTRRRQGVPVQPRRFFTAVWEHTIAPGQGVIVVAETPAGRLAAAAVVLAWNGVAVGKFQASDETCWELRPNHLCYWAAIRWATETGLRRFDFGRTEKRHAGLQRWKASWGGDEVPLRYALTGRGDLGVEGHGLLDAALRQVIRHSPTMVCRALGTMLYRYAA
jgi:CelD/BcsL family acetyltransferase involved in cellulose biosynthesis